MSLLAPNFDINDDNLYRWVFLDYIIKESDIFPVILLLDRNNVVDMQELTSKINGQGKGLAMYCDMSQCQASNYIPFVNQLARPFAQGAIDYLLLDNIGKIPKSKLRDEFKQLLKYMAKREYYDPYIPGSESGIKRGTEDFGKAGHLIMRCSRTPSFLQWDTYIRIKCKDYVRLTTEFVANDK